MAISYAQYSTASTLAVGMTLYSNSTLTTPVAAGYYSNGTVCYTTNASGVITSITNCGGGTPTTTTTTAATSSTLSGTAAVLSNPSSASSNDGSIQITPSGGNPTYQYSIDGGTTWQSSDTFTTLSTGVYTPKIKDASNTIVTLETETLTAVGEGISLLVGDNSQGLPFSLSFAEVTLNTDNSVYQFPNYNSNTAGPGFFDTIASFDASAGVNVKLIITAVSGSFQDFGVSLGLKWTDANGGPQFNNTYSQTGADYEFNFTIPAVDFSAVNPPSPAVAVELFFTDL